MPRKLTKIDSFAQKLIEELPPSQRPYPGEMTYVATSARLISKKLENFYANSGANPPEFSTVRNWFYGDCPDWAIAVLYHATSQNKVIV